MLAVLRRRDYALLWSAGFISVLGDWFLAVALPFFVYRMTGSALATGLLLAVRTLPPVLLGSLAGVFVDRWDGRRTMVAADLSRAAFLLLLLLVRSPDALWLVYLVLLGQETIAQFFGPSKQVLLPSLIGREDLLAANALASFGGGVARLAGPALGGVLLGVFGLPSAVVADSFSFFLSALLIMRIRAPATGWPAPWGDAVAAPGWRLVWRDWSDGLRVVRGDRTLAMLFLAMGAFWLSQGVFGVLIVPFVQGTLGMDAQVYGAFFAIQALGGLAGGVLVGRLGQALAPAFLVGLGLVSSGLVLLALFSAPSATVALVWAALAGLPGVGLLVGAQTLLQAGSPPAYRGRVFGAYGTITATLGLAGMGIAGGLAGRLGAPPLLDAGAALYLLAGMVALVLLPRWDAGPAATDSGAGRQPVTPPRPP